MVADSEVAVAATVGVGGLEEAVAMAEAAMGLEPVAEVAAEAAPAEHHPVRLVAEMAAVVKVVVIWEWVMEAAEEEGLEAVVAVEKKEGAWVRAMDAPAVAAATAKAASAVVAMVVAGLEAAATAEVAMGSAPTAVAAA